MDAKAHQVIAFHVGARSRDSAKELWANILLVYRERAMRFSSGGNVQRIIWIPP
jgi:hypothetical protein